MINSSKECVYACRAVASISSEMKTFANANATPLMSRKGSKCHCIILHGSLINFYLSPVMRKFKYHCTCNTDNIFNLIHLRKNYRSLQIFCIYFQRIEISRFDTYKNDIMIYLYINIFQWHNQDIRLVEIIT